MLRIAICKNLQQLSELKKQLRVYIAITSGKSSIYFDPFPLKSCLSDLKIPSLRWFSLITLVEMVAMARHLDLSTFVLVILCFASVKNKELSKDESRVISVAAETLIV